ncbi:hypothetical protein R1sor_021580 [Riccia sorocarpa]|uniref:Uncharacterized protein n=1 Tax=Riccia sorocarpa TaxID=122646 RepID=A0ABD3GLP4_9MARC
MSKLSSVLEATNDPTDPEADEVLVSKGVIVLPDIYWRSYSQLLWIWIGSAPHIEELIWDKVNSELQKYISSAYGRHQGSVQES